MFYDINTHVITNLIYLISYVICCYRTDGNFCFFRNMIVLVSTLYFPTVFTHFIQQNVLVFSLCVITKKKLFLNANIVYDLIVNVNKKYLQYSLFRVFSDWRNIYQNRNRICWYDGFSEKKKRRKIRLFSFSFLYAHDHLRSIELSRIIIMKVSDMNDD